MEHNHFKDTLEAARSTVTTCADTVHSGWGSPLDAIADPVANGGWVCSEADAWLTELTDQCAGITEAFDEAATVIQQEIDRAPEQVGENDPHGDAWNRTWSSRRNRL